MTTTLTPDPLLDYISTVTQETIAIAMAADYENLADRLRAARIDEPTIRHIMRHSPEVAIEEAEITEAAIFSAPTARPRYNYAALHPDRDDFDPAWLLGPRAEEPTQEQVAAYSAYVGYSPARLDAAAAALLSDDVEPTARVYLQAVRVLRAGSVRRDHEEAGDE